MNGQRLHQVLRQLYIGAKQKSRHLSVFSKRLDSFVTFIEREVDSWPVGASIALRRRLKLWRHGFLSEDGIAYDITEADSNRYLSHYGQVKAGSINGDWSIVNANKLVFHRMLEPFQEHRTPVFGRLTQGRFIPMESPGEDSESCRNDLVFEHTSSSPPSTTTAPEQSDASEWIREYLRTEGSLVLKPITGGMGKEVLVCSWTDGVYDVNNESIALAEFVDLVAGLDGYLICAFVEQAPYAAGLFADASNTLRVITMWDEERGEAFIPIATHRIGTEESAPVDNCTQGGLSAEIDLKTGGLGQAIRPLSVADKEWYSTHPDTGARIEDVEIPGWQAIRDRVLEMASSFPETPYLAWDLIVTNPGEFVVVEANNSAAVRFPQLHRPLLADPRARRFYETHNVI